MSAHVVGICEACGGLYHPAAPECSRAPDPNPGWARERHGDILGAQNALTLATHAHLPQQGQGDSAAERNPSLRGCDGGVE